MEYVFIARLKFLGGPFMDKEEFNSMVEKYKNELTKYLGKNNDSLKNDNIDKQSDDKKDNIFSSVRETESKDVSSVSNTDVTYKEFMDSNPKAGRLKIQSFCDDEIPLGGVRVRIKKNFSDGERVFFDGYTDKNGNINGILLPAPDHMVIDESEQNDCPHVVYDVEVMHDNYDLDCEDNVRSFSHIESVYPIKVTLPKEEKSI